MGGSERETCFLAVSDLRLQPWCVLHLPPEPISSCPSPRPSLSTRLSITSTNRTLAAIRAGRLLHPIQPGASDSPAIVARLRSCPQHTETEVQAELQVEGAQRRRLVSRR